MVIVWFVPKAQPVIAEQSAPGLPPPAPPPPPEPPPEPPPPPPPPAVVTSRFGRPPGDLDAAIQRHFPESEWRNAADVSHVESIGWQRAIVNDTVSRFGPCGTRYTLADGTPVTTEISVGYFQINICAHGGSIEYWQDTDNNVAEAATLWRSAGGKWSPWWITAGRLGLPR